MNKRKLLRLVFFLIVLYAGYKLFWNVKGDIDFQKGLVNIQSVKESLRINLPCPSSATSAAMPAVQADVKVDPASSQLVNEETHHSQLAYESLPPDREYSPSADTENPQPVREKSPNDAGRARKADIELFYLLKAEVPDLVAWLTIPGAEIDIPIVQGPDNVFYLNHDYLGNYNPYGAPFLDQGNDHNFKDQNSIIYAHNLPGQKVFGELPNYQDPDFLKKAPAIELLTGRGKVYYDIKCVYVVDPYANFRSFQYEELDWQTFTDRWLEKNILDLPTPRQEDHLLTLQTCLVTDERLVIHAVRQD